MSSLLWLAAFPSVLAAPDHAAALAESSTAVKDLTVAANDAWIAWTTTAGELQVLDTSTWTVINVSLDGGATASGGVAIGGSDAAPMLFAGLSDNTIGQWALKQGEGAVFMAFNAVEGTPLALAADGNTLCAIVDNEDSGPVATGYDVANFIARYSEVADLSYDGFVDMDARLDSSASEDGAALLTYLYVAHGNAQLSRVSVGESTITSATSTENEGNLTIQDVWTEDGGTTTWFANSGSTGSTAYLASDSADIDLTAPSSPNVGSGLGIGGLAAEGWIGISEASSLHIFTYAGGSTIGDELGTIDEAAGATEIAAMSGYGFAATSAGTWVITDRPWVEITAISASDVAPDEELTLTFTSDTAGSFQVSYQVAGAGLTPENVDGASGDVEAGVETTATVTLPSTGADVRYLVEVQVTPSGTTSFGRDGEYVDVNEPAPAPTINASTVSFGDESIRVTFDAFDLDVAQSYVVYLTTVEFASDDYETGGPAYVGPDKDPGLLTADPDEYGVFDCYIGGLTNGTTYYVAARAIDADDGTYSESPMSDVFAATPEETYSLSERLGIEGWCGLPLESAGWLGSIAAAAIGLRRRVRAPGAGRAGAAGTVAGLVALIAVALPSVAQAKPHEDDLTPRSWNFEVRYGAFLSQENTELKEAFGDSDNRLLRTDWGWTSNFVEVDLGFGLYSDEGGQTTSSGETSADSDKLTVVPLAIDGTLRLDIWREQPVVPFVRAGADYWIWNETWTSPYDASGGGDTTDGTFGWHWGAGLYLLLDALDEGAASRLETVASVNDTYLVAEYRQTYSLGTDTLDFTSTDITVGLKFDY